ncbi:DUF421 domain-containing protein [Halobacillus naozhouensis]|uniref:DUF421 domain-containing protein n=1 Tax=Halobacillus naozhouensis TaxID=554880 RepID=A0ABY8IWS0_9BACI|nr:YetF domain-containing protein [Halobacillus naozhouensis]WFT73759.1 DUF421 domain-containing protein [Halobacillus naozhouensis]
MIFFIKILTLYLVTIAIMRIMGKSTIVQMTPYDLVAIIIIGTLASEPLISTKFIPTIIALGILVLLHVLFSLLTLNQIGNRLFLGQPTLLIKKGEILEDNLEKAHLSVGQLLSILRSKGYPKVSDVEYALLEPIGELSVIPTAANTPVTVEHMNITIQDEGLPIAVIVDGRIQNHNLTLLDLDKDWLDKELRHQGSVPKDIIYAFVNEKTKRLMINKRKSKS